MTGQCRSSRHWQDPGRDKSPRDCSGTHQHHSTQQPLTPNNRTMRPTTHRMPGRQAECGGVGLGWQRACALRRCFDRQRAVYQHHAGPCADAANPRHNKGLLHRSHLCCQRQRRPVVSATHIVPLRARGSCWFSSLTSPTRACASHTTSATRSTRPPHQRGDGHWRHAVVRLLPRAQLGTERLRLRCGRRCRALHTGRLLIYRIPRHHRVV